MTSYEQAVIGAIMLDATAYWQVADMIGASDFAEPKHQTIFAAIVELAENSKPVDAVTMGDELPEFSDYLLTIATNTPGSANVRAYAEELRKASEIRRVKRAGLEIAGCGEGFVEAHRILAGVAPRDSHAVKPVKDYMRDALALMQKQCDAEEPLVGLSTGLADLDMVTLGLQPATLTVIAARPSMGKTALGMQLGLRNTLRGHRVMVFEMEMSGVQLVQRAVSLISGVKFERIKRPQMLEDVDWPKVTDAYGKLEKSALIVDESSSQTIETICARARQEHMKSKLSMIVVDHLGLINLPGKTREAVELGDVTKRLKALAKDLSIPIVCLVQLNRSVEQRHDKRPLLSDLRESGRIEEDADVVMMIYRDDYYHPDSPDKGLAELLIRKNRDGETKTIDLVAKLDVMKFEAFDGQKSARKSEPAAISFSKYRDGKTAACGPD